jgi:hypothetical protein
MNVEIIRIFKYYFLCKPQKNVFILYYTKNVSLPYQFHLSLPKFIFMKHSFLTLRKAWRVLAAAVLPIVLLWHGCTPTPIDPCAGASVPNIKADITYTVLGDTTHWESSIAATWQVSSPVNKYKVVLTQLNATPAELKNVIVNTTAFSYQSVRTPNSTYELTVTPLGLDNKPCAASASTLRVANPNGGIVTIDIVGKRVAAGGTCIFPLGSTAQFCTPVVDVLRSAKIDVAPSATQVNIVLSALPSTIGATPVRCTTLTYTTGWGGANAVISDFQPYTNKVTTAIANLTCAGTGDFIDFSASPTSYKVLLSN